PGAVPPDLRRADARPRGVHRRPGGRGGDRPRALGARGAAHGGGRGGAAMMSGVGPTPVGDGSAEDDLRLSSDREVVGRMAGLLRPHRMRLLWSLVLIVIASAATLAQPRIVQVSIDQGITAGNLPVLNLMALAYVATLVVFWVTSYYQVWILSVVGQDLLYVLRTRM